MQAKLKNSRGFTLLELLMALAIFGIVVGAIYTTYLSQQNSYIIQEQVAGMQQNLRAGMFIMERELRLAGYASDVQKPSGLGIIALGDQDFRDNDNDGTIDGGATERNMGVVFTYMREPDGIDNDTNGTVDDESDVMIFVQYSLFISANNTVDLGRDDGSGIQSIAENIDFLEFIFLDSSANPTTALADIRSVRITMVARAGRADINYTDNKSYQDAAGNTVYTSPLDNFRRRVLSTVVKCRNLGL